MNMFLLYLVALLALALLLVLPTLLRSQSAATSGSKALDARQANLRVLREQLATLDAEQASGALDAGQYQLARSEIERRALEEEQQVDQPALAARSGKTAVALGLFIPIFVVAVYGWLGNPQALTPAAAVAAGIKAGDVTPDQIEAMVDGLSKRLYAKTTTEPGDLQSWTMLARSYAVLQRYAEASRAFARARTLAPDDAQLLADHADVMAMVQGQNLAGEPTQLVERALQLDPQNLKALALAGSAAFQRKDFAAALSFWGRAQQLASPGSEFAAGLQSSIQEARSASAGSAPALAAAPAQPAKVPAQAAAADSAAGSPGSISGVVQLAGAMAAKAAPDDTVFVFARAAQGPRMPLAILKRKVSDLPLSFSLDDSSAMSPEMSLSKFPSVVVGARISRSGDATPRSGDLVGQVGPVGNNASKLVIKIDGVQP
jgi:cytochrome c-type biogenesis protein CcmH